MESYGNGGAEDMESHVDGNVKNSKVEMGRLDMSMLRALNTLAMLQRFAALCPSCS